MFQLLQPIWLSALAALSVPVVIHLWNQRPKHTLRVGSTALAPESAISVKRSVKLSQLILLLLRCLFLTCIVLALASPAWKTNPAGQKNGWVLIPPEGFAATYQHFQPKVDSLLQAGFELHLFDEKFQKVSPAMAPAAHDSSQEPVVSYRRLVAALDDHLPAQLPVYIFSDNYLRHFSGSRVPVSLNLNWYDYTPAADTIRDEMNPAPVTVTILAKKASIDSRYLSAVLKAISDYSGRSITLNLVEGAHDIKPGTDWLFCLDGNKPDKGQVVDHLVVAVETRTRNGKCGADIGDSEVVLDANLRQAKVAIVGDAGVESD